MNPALNIEDPVKTQLYRITQEATSNAIKHSGASTITIAVNKVDGQFELSVLDNGKGFDM